MSANPPSPFSVGTTFGAVLIGATLASALFGVTTMLFFVYYRRYYQDSLFYRLPLAILWVLDLLHFVLGFHILHFYLVDSFGDVLALSNMVWSFKLDFSIHVGNSPLSQYCSYINIQLAIVVGVDLVCVLRLCLLGRYFHRIVPWIISIVVAGAVTFVILLIYKVYTISNFSQFSGISRTMNETLVAGAVSDLTICLSMCFYLFKSREVALCSGTSGRLLVLLRLVLMTGLAETAASILMLVVSLTLPDTLIFVAIAFPIPRIYIISLLTMLNARTPQSSNGFGRRKACLPIGGNELNLIPSNFMDVVVTDEESTVVESTRLTGP